MYYDTQSAPRPDRGGKTKVWKIVVLVFLLLCALPVLVPISLCVAGGVLVVALCVAGAALTAVLCGRRTPWRRIMRSGRAALSGTDAACRADWNRLRCGSAFSGSCKRSCSSGRFFTDDGSGRVVLDRSVAAGKASDKRLSRSCELVQPEIVQKTGSEAGKKRNAGKAGCTGGE